MLYSYCIEEQPELFSESRSSVVGQRNSQIVVKYGVDEGWDNTDLVTRYGLSYFWAVTRAILNDHLPRICTFLYSNTLVKNIQIQ